MTPDEAQDVATPEVAPEVAESKPLGEEIGPFRATVEWVAGSSEEDIQAAQEFVTNLVKDASVEGNVPACVQSVKVSRI